MELLTESVVICLKIRTFVVSATTSIQLFRFATCCDLLENSYLCGISNNTPIRMVVRFEVVICLKIRTFVVSATTDSTGLLSVGGCDLLENSYLCGISNNLQSYQGSCFGVVICLKIRTFVVSATTPRKLSLVLLCCDLLENSYLCGISNNYQCLHRYYRYVVICLKIRTFVVSATT